MLNVIMSVGMLNAIMLRVVMLRGHYAECHYAECHYAECHSAECHYAECHGANAISPVSTKELLGPRIRVRSMDRGYLAYQVSQPSMPVQCKTY